jgi:FkbM family methyltransferase
MSKYLQVERDGYQFTVVDSEICKLENGWNFWEKDFPSIFEPFTIRFMNRILDRTVGFLDVGAWVGPTTLYASRIAKSVTAYEPDPVAFAALRDNIELNSEVPCIPKNAAITVDGQPIPLYSRTYHGDSMSNIMGDGVFINTINSVTLPEAVGEDNFGLIKMDIEGAESRVLPANKEFLGDVKIPLIVSFHGAFYKEVDAFEKIVDALGVYSEFYDENDNEVSLRSLRSNFDTVLCL